MTNQLKEAENRLKNGERKSKEDKEKLQAEKEELNKILRKMQTKETHYKHELRQKELQVAKLQETMKSKMFTDTKTANNKQQ